jgi:mRNA interferase RelE/StbE
VYAISIKPSALKELKKLPGSVKRKCELHIDELHENPRPTGCAKLRGKEKTYLIRIGKYRIVYFIDDDGLLVKVLAVRKRADIYR